MKARIVERTGPDGLKMWVIQQRHWLFWWTWTDAWINSWAGASCNDTFFSLEDAEKNLCHFDGTPTIKRVVG